jgi:hypothetical protein
MLLPLPSPPSPLTPVFVVFEVRKPVLEPVYEYLPAARKQLKLKKKKDKCTSNVQESGKYSRRNMITIDQ